MSRDGTLREVLDSLSEEAARTLPRQDRELMESVLRRLKIQEARRPRPYETRAERPRSMSELEAAREDARRRLEELEALREQHGQEQEALRRIAAERDALLEQQRELEERLARLEASSHGGPLSYVEDEEVVEFARVDLAPSDDLVEFQYLGSDEDGGFEAPDESAWADERPGAAPGWDEPTWDGNGSADGDVDWDSDDDSGTAASPWQGGVQEDEPWPDDVTAGGAGRAEETASWAEPDAEESGPPTEESPVWSQETQEASGLDEQTQDELADLEKQLADLEREIEEREKREKRGST